MVATCSPFCYNFSFSATFSARALCNCSFKTISSIISSSPGDYSMIIGLMGGVFCFLWLFSALKYIEVCLFLFALRGAMVATSSLHWANVVLCCDSVSCPLSTIYMNSMAISYVFPWPFVSSSYSYGSSCSSSGSSSSSSSSSLRLGEKLPLVPHYCVWYVVYFES